LFDQARYELQHGDKRGAKPETWTNLDDEERRENVERSSEADEDTQ
jgi:hypothetical protein